LYQERAPVPYCPNCLTEYVKGTEECEDCKVSLLPGSPPARGGEESSEPDRAGAVARWFRSLVGAGPECDEPEAKTVRIRTFFGNTAMLDADLARNLLRAHGIPSILPGETSVELLPFLEVPLLVREEDAERAKSILRDYFDQSGTEGPALVE
jgi:Putative prokaryotic signal transducing protein